MRLLVVARYQEDIAWTRDLPHGWLVWVVQKDRDLPNLGREPSSFLYAIERLYPGLQPTDTLAFVQGHPFDHCPDLLEQLTQPINGYRPLGNRHLTSDREGNPHHHGLDVGPSYGAWLGKPFPGEVPFTAGGQFAVTGAQIRARGVEFYRHLYDEVMRNERLAWVLERLWPAVFA